MNHSGTTGTRVSGTESLKQQTLLFVSSSFYLFLIEKSESDVRSKFSIVKQC